MAKRCVRRRRSHKARKARRAFKTRRQRRQQGGGLPIPRGAVASMSLDAKDEYAVPVLVRREVAEEELLEE
jgi:hypothetical protein